MSTSVKCFYDELAADYHHVYSDWESAIERQSFALDQLIQGEVSAHVSFVLDCSCGIGTQAIGLARRGYKVFASDISAKAVGRAETESANRGLSIGFAVADVREVDSAFNRKFDAVICCDNSLSHLLTNEDLTLALQSIRLTLKKDDGLFLASIRDYDQLLVKKPASQMPIYKNTSEGEVVTFQIWDWSQKSDTYLVRFFVVWQTSSGWEVKELRTFYRAIKRDEFNQVLASVGYKDIAWHAPEETGYFQPIVTARA